LESAVEIAKQLRLRDIGGLVVIDFIDMLSLKNKRAVEDKLWSALSIDRAKVQVGRISRFGLMEMSRQRLRPSLQERWTQDVASLSTAVLRLVEEEASKKKSGEVRAIVSSDMSIFLLNERRSRINEIEERTNVRVIVVSDPTRSDNRFEVSRLRSDDKRNKDHASYDIQSEIESSANNKRGYKKTKLEKPAVNLTPPKKPKKKGEGLFRKLLKLFSNPDEASKSKSKGKNTTSRRKPNNDKNRKSQKNVSKPNSRSRNNKSVQKKVSNNKNVKRNEDKNDTTLKDKESSNQNQQKPQSRKKDQKSSNQRNRKKVDSNIEEANKNNPKKSSASNESLKEGNSSKKQKENNKIKESEKDNQDKPDIQSIKKNNDSIQTETVLDTPNKETKKAKDWGRAANDPRNK